MTVAGGQPSGAPPLQRGSRSSATSVVLWAKRELCEALKRWSCCLIVPVLLLSKSSSLLSALIRPAQLSRASTLDDVMRNVEGDTEVLAEMLESVFRSNGDAGACAFKILARASPGDASPLEDRLPHMPQPRSRRRAPAAALEGLRGPSEADLWTRPPPEVPFHLLPKPAAVAAATAAAAAAAAAAATESGGRSMP